MSRTEWPTEGLLANGDYAKAPDGKWYAMTPNGHLANLRAHTITEHEDGTITADPSILVSVPGDYTTTNDAMRYPVRGEELWHGFLERGVWRAC